MRVADGVHEYVVAPLAVNSMLSPWQIVGPDGDTETVGLEFTVITTPVVEVQP